MVAYMSIVPDVVHHVDMMPGNDEIEGGEGSDMIIGDDLRVYSPLFTGLQVIERASQDIAAEANMILYGLHNLALDYELRDRTVLGVMNSHDIRYGNDRIEGGEGDDLVIGDNAEFSVPFMVGLPVSEADFTAAALKYQGFLRDMEHVAFDFLNVIEEAHVGVLNDLVADALMHNPDRIKPRREDLVDPDLHDLFVGNDEIDGGTGHDEIGRAHV